MYVPKAEPCILLTNYLGSGRGGVKGTRDQGRTLEAELRKFLRTPGCMDFGLKDAGDVLKWRGSLHGLYCEL